MPRREPLRGTITLSFARPRSSPAEASRAPSCSTRLVRSLPRLQTLLALGRRRTGQQARRISTVNTSIDQAAISLGVATLVGASIGFERQWRQRMAGLRTNTLVAIGAASFVIFAGLFPDEGSPTRVAAQVVSGIGFLGAGIIFREGLQVTGLNTAATLWCSAAVGLLAGSGPSAACGAGDKFCRSRQSDVAASGSDHQSATDHAGRNRLSLSRSRRLPKSGRGACPGSTAAKHQQWSAQLAAPRQHRPREQWARRSRRTAYRAVKERRGSRTGRRPPQS